MNGMSMDWLNIFDFYFMLEEAYKESERIKKRNKRI